MGFDDEVVEEQTSVNSEPTDDEIKEVEKVAEESVAEVASEI